jgi:hypothetical protein
VTVPETCPSCGRWRGQIGGSTCTVCRRLITCEEVEQLVSNGAEAERSLELRAGLQVKSLNTAVYRGARKIKLATGDTADVFAIQIDGKDVMFARTPELAKFIVELLTIGEKLTAEFLEFARNRREP